MPRGKYVNHKGRSRNFTNPEELQHQKDDSSEDESSSEGEEGATGGASGSTHKKSTKGRVSVKKTTGSSSEDSDEESSGEDRDARKGVASLIEIENPNRAVKKAAQKVSNLTLDEEGGEQQQQQRPKPELTRREREQMEKQKAKIRYDKLHAAGKTNEAKADLARLALIRQQRAEAAAKREADKKAVEDKKAPASKP